MHTLKNGMSIEFSALNLNLNESHTEASLKFRGLQVSLKILQKLECLDLRLNLLEQSKPKVPDDVDAGSPLETLLERVEILLRQIQELCNPRRALQKTWKSSAECDILPELNVIASFKSNVQRSRANLKSLLRLPRSVDCLASEPRASPTLLPSI